MIADKDTGCEQSTIKAVGHQIYIDRYLRIFWAGEEIDICEILSCW